MKPVDRSAFDRGLCLFNSAEFYDAHEVWEDVWRPLPPSAEKKFLQGLIQIAVGLHHHSTGNTVGALSLLKRGTHNLRHSRTDALRIDVDEFLLEVEGWGEALKSRTPLPSFPKIAKWED
jgi:predicted metal-dependent hydrolase